MSGQPQRSSLRNALNQSVGVIPKYKDLSSKRIDKIQQKEDYIMRGIYIEPIKIQVKKRKSYGNTKGSPKMRFKSNHKF